MSCSLGPTSPLRAVEQPVVLVIPEQVRLQDDQSVPGVMCQHV